MNTNTITTWDELMTKQAKDRTDHMTEYKKAFDQLQTDQKALRNNMPGGAANTSVEIKEIFDRQEEAFKNEWGLVYGRRSKAIGFQQQKEIDEFLNRKLEIDKGKERFAHTPEKEKALEH